MIRMHKLILIFMILLISCVATEIQDIWKDNNYQSKIKKIFVIGVSQVNIIRRQFENEFVNQLTIKGIEAIPSYTVLSPDKMLDKNTIVSKIKDMNIDGVIITQLIKKTREYTTVPGNTYHTNYVKSYNSGSVSSADLVILETNLYDAKSEELVWSGLSKTINQRTTSNAIKPVIEVIIQNLSKDNMI